MLRATRPPGDAPIVRALPSRADEVAFVVERIGAFRSEAVPLEEMAVMCRTNARLVDWHSMAEANPNYVGDDGVHCTSDGATALAAAVRQAIG